MPLPKLASLLAEARELSDSYKAGGEQSFFAYKELHGSKVVFVGAIHAGLAGEAEATLAPLRSLGTPLVDMSGLFPYVAVQSGADEAFPAGGRYYMKSHFLDELTDTGIDTMLECYARRPTPETLAAIRTLGGAVARVGDNESAFAHRSARFNLSIDATWVDPAMDEVAIGWARSTWEEMRPFWNGGVYLNFSGLDDEAPASTGRGTGSESAAAGGDPSRLRSAGRIRCGCPPAVTTPGPSGRDPDLDVAEGQAIAAALGAMITYDGVIRTEKLETSQVYPV